MAEDTKNKQPQVEDTQNEDIQNEEPLVEESQAEKENNTDQKYYYAVGRRKCAIAKVKIFPNGEGRAVINAKELKDYFPTLFWQETVVAPLQMTNNDKNFDIEVKVIGGGKRGQSEAVRLGVARALVVFNEEYRTVIKKAGFLRRDARVKERKKPGLKGARRAPQWSKR